ncbi:hypothetical protein MetMK1DRAFT_00020290 [Metallosphaera yellowstonensis MK1]|uniref:Uncharacterized protein n=1 Tax=Metallosphaera yellowstonensis MK1 TaxID=671065 RepID=H2C653_9CREN|nr:hypothetical protein MetMK1DRAFT_00020290 [Metallosphaera yellowstonensis MK1]
MEPSVQGGKRLRTSSRRTKEMKGCPGLCDLQDVEERGDI